MKSESRRLKWNVLRFWFILYEFLSIVVVVVRGFLLFHIGAASPINSINFIRGRSPIISITSIWLSNLTSFLLGGTIVIIHPLLGLLPVTLNSWSMGGVLSSWLAGYTSLAHLIYGVAETQTYIILWLMVVKAFVIQKSQGSTIPNIISKWNTTARYVKQVTIISSLLFLLLSIIEVAEVLIYG